MGLLKSIFGADKSNSPPRQINKEIKNTEPVYVKASKNNKLLAANLSKPADTSAYYTNSDLVNTCVSFISDIASQVQIKIYEERAGELIPTKNQKLLDWQHTPNPFMPMSQLIKGYIQSYLISGNGYLTFEKIGGSYESWLLTPNRTEIVPDTKKYITGFIFDKQISYKAEEVIHFKNVEVSRGYYGISPLIALTDILLTESYATDDLKAFYENSLIVSGLLSSEYPLSDRQVDSLKAQFNALYGKGGEERFGFIIASNDLQYKPLKLSPKDGMLLEALGITEDRVYEAFKVDKALVGRASSNSANIKEVKLNFLNNVIRPMIYQLLQTLETHFKRVFKNNNIRVLSDYSNIPEISEISESKVSAITKMLASGVISFNEARDALNYKQKEGVYMDSQFAPSYLSGSNPTDLVTGEQVQLSPTNQQPVGSNSTGGSENTPTK